ncbi:MAG TPA: glycerophosphodiester phosphodiesterase [Solirubrobacteraceae bacterium]
MQPGARAVAVPRGEHATPLIVAHRGAWGAAPQNSLEAFDAAVALGCDAIELDVRRTADGRFVVVHDARIGGRPVAHLEHHELRARVRPGQAPSLEEVLELAAGRIGLDVELKENGYVEATMAIVAKRLAPDQYVVTSFRDAVLPAIKRCVPEARTGLLLSPRRRLRDLERRVRDAQVDFLAPHASLARDELMDWAASRGLPSWVWTVNEPRTLRGLLADERVAAIITDKPDRALDGVTSP